MSPESGDLYGFCGMFSEMSAVFHYILNEVPDNRICTYIVGECTKVNKGLHNYYLLSV